MPTTHAIPIERLDPAADNPRAAPSSEDLAPLIRSIERRGVLQPILCRPHPGDPDRFEIIAGERRYRAAKAAGLAEIPATVRAVDDAEALELQAVENFQREDLDPIAQARQLDALTRPKDRGGAGMTQKGAGRVVGLSQPAVANKLRLLKLPADWRKRLISGEITESRARKLLPYVAAPKVLATLFHELQRAGEFETDEDFDVALDGAVGESVRPLEGDEMVWIDGRHQFDTVAFKPTEDQLRELEAVKLPGPDGKPALYAQNIGKWGELQAAALNTKAESGNKAAESPAERKARAKRLAEQRKKRLADFRRRLLCDAVARRLDRNHGTGPAFAAVTMLIYCIIARDPAGAFYEALVAAARERGVKLRRDRYAPLETALRIDPAVRHPAALDAILSMLRDDSCRLPAILVEDLARLIGADTESAWIDAQHGDARSRQMVADFWTLHTKAELADLAEELDLSLRGASTRPAMLKKFAAETAGGRTFPLPKSLRAIEPRKRKPKAKNGR